MSSSGHRVGGVHGSGAGVLSAAPEALSAVAFGAAWFVPTELPPGFVRGLLLSLLVEFLVIHSFAFMGLAVFDETRKRSVRLSAVLGFGALYVGMAAALSAAFGSRAPLWAMAWLIASRVLTVAIDRRPTGEEMERQKVLWGSSAALYIFGVVLTSIVPLPRFGLAPEVVASLSLPGSGQWVEKPQTLVAFGLLYFGAMAVLEIREARAASKAG